MKTALMAQLSLQTGYGRNQAQRVMGRRVVERHLGKFVSAVWDEIHRGCFNHFHGRYKDVVNRQRRGQAQEMDPELLRNMEDGLDTWKATADQEKLTFP